MAEYLENIIKAIPIEPIRLEIGYNLVKYVNNNSQDSLINKIKQARKLLAVELGAIIPAVRILDNIKLNEFEYIIKFKGVIVGRWILKENKILVISSRSNINNIEGEETEEPIFGMKAKWIKSKLRGNAENKGYSTTDPINFIFLHLKSLFYKYSYDFIGRNEVKILLDTINESNRVLVEEALKLSSLGEIKLVLRGLLYENVSIRNITTILETIADYSKTIKSIDKLIDITREKLASQISKKFCNENDVIKVFCLTKELEKKIEQSLVETNNVIKCTISSEIILKILNKASYIIKKAKEINAYCVILTTKKLRRIIREIFKKHINNISILSTNEIPHDIYVNVIEYIKID